MANAAKEQAIHDIQDECLREGKQFYAFISDLDEVMDLLVNNQITQQSTLSK